MSGRSETTHKSHRRRSRSPLAREARELRLASEARRALARSKGELPAVEADTRTGTPSDEEELEQLARQESEERRQRRDEIRDRKGKSKLVTTWGKHGLIQPSDLYSKRDEFRLWLVEEQMLNPESLSQTKTKELFLKYMEDFNTATLPHEKYFNLEAWELRMRAIRMGERLQDGVELTYDLRRDEEAHRKISKSLGSERGLRNLSKDQLLDIQRVERERVEARNMKRLGIAVPTDLGVRMEDKALPGSTVDWATKSAWA